MQSVGETAGVCNREVYGIIYVYNRWGALNRSGGRRDPPLRFDHEWIVVGAGFHARPREDLHSPTEIVRLPDGGEY